MRYYCLKKKKGVKPRKAEIKCVVVACQHLRVFTREEFKKLKKKVTNKKEGD